MPQTIRPERVYVEEDALVIEYTVEKYDDSSCQVSVVELLCVSQQSLFYDSQLISF